jgi:hypothetical protein
MAVVGLGALAVVGLLAAAWFVRTGSLAERLGYALLFAVGGPPLVTSILALCLSRHVTAGLAWGTVAGLLALLGALHCGTRLRHLRPPRPTADDALLLGLALLVGGGAAIHYTDAELLLNLAAYLDTGEAKCFYMQTFELTAGLAVGAAGPRPEVFFDIINTPGNTLFTAGLMPLAGLHTFRILYVAFGVTLFLFVRLLAAELTGRKGIATAVALFAVANPYTLSIEVLDRNLIALALSAVLWQAVRSQPRSHLLHGLVFGALAGSGLRFLPAIHLVPVLAMYFAGRARLRGYLTFGGAALAVAAINLPHLARHGLHSLGESEPLWGLAAAAITEHLRTPFLPYPNAELYALNLLGHLGLLVAAVVLVGAVASWRRDRVLAGSLVWIVALPFVVLACQRDWLEGEKLRILLCAGLSWTLWLALGLDPLLRRGRPWRRLAGATAALAFVAGLTLGLARVDAPADTGTYARKPVYQTETPAYLTHLRQTFARPTLLPGYHRLFLKLRYPRKRREAGAIHASLFGPGSTYLQSPWIARWLPAREQPEPLVVDDPAVTLRLDLDRLVGDGEGAIRIEADESPAFVDITDPQRLDVVFKQVDVTWQPEALPVVAFPLRTGANDPGELILELNAYHALGEDELGLVRIGPIHQWLDEAARTQGIATGLTALPQSDRAPDIVLRVPRGATVLVRNWLVDGIAGVPHRIDSWSMEADENGTPRISFHPFEPESYL